MRMWFRAPRWRLSNSGNLRALIVPLESKEFLKRVIRAGTRVSAHAHCLPSKLSLFIRHGTRLRYADFEPRVQRVYLDFLEKSLAYTKISLRRVFKPGVSHFAE